MRAPWSHEHRDWFAACCHKSAGGQTTDTTPWAPAQPYIKTGYEAAEQNILNRPTSFFPGSTVVPFSPESQAALGGTANRAYWGSPVLGAAQDYTTDLLTNPGSSPVYDAVRSDVRPGVDAAFGRAGRQGTSPLADEAYGRGISRALAPYMESAAGRAPGLAREDYYDLERLAGVGAAREAKQGQHLGEQMARWDFAQQEPAQRTQAYISALSGVPMGQTSTSSRNVNPIYNILGMGTELGGAYLGGK